MLGIDGGDATTFVEVGYSIADIVAKAVFSVLIFVISHLRSRNQTLARSLSCGWQLLVMKTISVLA